MTEAWCCNASPLISLARIDRLDLLAAVAPVVDVPQAVLSELAAGGDLDDALRAIGASPRLRIVGDLALPVTLQEWGLGAGEGQVLARALVRVGTGVILDDLAGRRRARAAGLPLIGTLGVVARARRRGLIPAARPVMHALVEAGLFIAPALVEQVLADLDEP